MSGKISPYSTFQYKNEEESTENIRTKASDKSSFRIVSLFLIKILCEDKLHGDLPSKSAIDIDIDTDSLLIIQK